MVKRHIPNVMLISAAFISQNIEMIKYVDKITDNICNFAAVQRSFLFNTEKRYKINWERIEAAFPAEFKRYNN